MLVCMGLVLAWNVTNYMLTSYMPTYVTDTMPDMQGGDGVSATTSQILQIVVMAVALVTIPLLGMLSDRIGRKPIAWVGVDRPDRAGLPDGPADPRRRPGHDLPRPADHGAAADLLQRDDALDAAVAVPDRGARRRAVDRASTSRSRCSPAPPRSWSAPWSSATGDLNWPAYYLIIAGVIGAVSIWFIAGAERPAHVGLPARRRSPTRRPRSSWPRPRPRSSRPEVSELLGQPDDVALRVGDQPEGDAGNRHRLLDDAAAEPCRPPSSTSRCRRRRRRT